MEMVHIRHDGIEGTALVPRSSLTHYTGHGWVEVPESELPKPAAEYATPKEPPAKSAAGVGEESDAPAEPVEVSPKTAGRGTPKEK